VARAGPPPSRGQGRGPRIRPAATLGIFVAIGVAIGAALAVGTRPPAPSPTPFVPPSGTAGSLPPPVIGTPANGSAPATSAAGSSGAAVAIDPSLLIRLPQTVDGLGLIEDPETESHDAADASHAADLAGLAVAVAADQSSGDLAVVSVVRLNPGVFSDDYYRSWRDTFDQGACSQAGGVAGSAETTIAGHPSFIGHCAGGVLTYHTYLTSGDLIVSVTSLGDRRLGERILEGLR